MLAQSKLLIEGMSCVSCEKRIIASLESIAGIKSVIASAQTASVEIEYDSEMVVIQDIKKIIENLGYGIKEKNLKGTFISLLIAASLILVYMLLNNLGFFAMLPDLDSSLSYGMLLIAGLITSLHCIAMCGGIALSTGLKENSQNKNGKFYASIQYNAGRVVSYTIIGALVGALGSVFTFSPLAKAIIMSLAAVLMIFYAFSMFGFFTIKIHIFSFLPKIFKNARLFKLEQKHTHGSFVVGLLNGLMPCGPLQNMQLYALGTGSIILGGLSMFVFSIGTIPLMLLFASSALFLPKKILPIVVKASALVIMFLGVVTFARAASLIGFSISEFNQTTLVQTETVNDGTAAQDLGNLLTKDVIGKIKIENGNQTIITEFKNGSYVPFTVQVGLPLKWIIRVGSRDLNGCNNPLTIPALGIKKKLVPGDNIIEFTPKNVGVIVYTCWMGMVTSTITVQNAE